MSIWYELMRRDPSMPNGPFCTMPNLIYSQERQIFQMDIQNSDMPVLGNTGGNNIGDGVDGPDGGLGPAQHGPDPVVRGAVEESREERPRLQSLQPGRHQGVQVGWCCSSSRRQLFHFWWQCGRQSTHGGAQGCHNWYRSRWRRCRFR